MLKNIYVENITPFTVVTDETVNYEVDYIFQPENATLHVPAGAKEAYKADPYWGRFGIIVEDCAGVEEVADADSYAAASVEYFTLQGVCVENPAAGIYFRKVGNKVSKIVIP